MNEYDIDILRLAGAGYCCSQIVVQLGLEVQGTVNPGLVKAMAGLCHGFPAMDGSCGAVSGAACLVAYYGGKGSPDEDESDRLPLMLSELSGWFKEYATSRFKGIRCSDIVEDGQLDAAICGGLVGECYGKALTILVENGFDLEA
ncbi:DVU_1555 family C-GCAxxG-C-C protein [Desulforhopalus sp. 52FAK]